MVDFQGFQKVLLYAFFAVFAIFGFIFLFMPGVWFPFWLRLFSRADIGDDVAVTVCRPLLAQSGDASAKVKYFTRSKKEPML